MESNNTHAQRHGRPPIYGETMPAAIRVGFPDDLALALKQEAVKRGVSLSALVRELVKKGLKL